VIDRDGYLAAIRAGRGALMASAGRAGADAGVPSCRHWTVRELVTHAGNVHAWAALVLRTRVEQPQDFDVPPPAGGAGLGLDGLLTWYADQADDLLGLLAGDEVPDDTACWTFGPPGTAAFWARRQAHELTMHAVDGAMAAGESVAPLLAALDPELSADGVDEVLTVMLPRVAAFAPRPILPGRLALVADDAGRRWVLEPDGRLADSGDTAGSPEAASSAEAADQPEVAATLSGPAASLFGLLWKRAALDDRTALGLRVDGGVATVEALLAARLTP
jgi:uncharacterized protein (TIGR03083 family)